MFTLVPKRLSPSPSHYEVMITEELDTDYLKYLRRKIRPHRAPESSVEAVSIQRLSIQRLDVSLEDEEGDVVAGIAAWTQGDTLVIDIIWVDEALRGRGFGRKLVETAEVVAAERGCTVSSVTYAPSPDLYLTLGYHVTTRLVQFPNGQPFYRLHKALQATQTDCPCEQCEDQDNQYPQNKDEQPTCFAS